MTASKPSYANSKVLDAACLTTTNANSVLHALVIFLMISALVIIKYISWSKLGFVLLKAVFPHKETAATAFDIISIARLIGLLVVPTFATVTAPRWPTVWGLLPYLLIIGYSILLPYFGLPDPIDLGSPIGQLKFSLVIWIFTSLIGLGIRWIVKRNAFRQGGSAQELDGDHVWPPAIEPNTIS